MQIDFHDQLELQSVPQQASVIFGKRFLICSASTILCSRGSSSWRGWT
jgi:hypothetical protein